MKSESRVRHSVPFESFDAWSPGVAKVAAPDPEDDFADRLEDRLLDAGIPLETVDQILAVADAELDDEACRRAGAMIANLLWTRLGHSPAGTAIVRLLLGGGDLSLRDEAARLGVSHVALIDAEKRLRRMLCLPAAAT